MRGNCRCSQLIDATNFYALLAIAKSSQPPPASGACVRAGPFTSGPTRLSIGAEQAKARVMAAKQRPVPA